MNLKGWGDVLNGDRFNKWSVCVTKAWYWNRQKVTAESLIKQCLNNAHVTDNETQTNWCCVYVDYGNKTFQQTFEYWKMKKLTIKFEEAWYIGMFKYVFMKHFISQLTNHCWKVYNLNKK